jgi:hypothetical protein
VRTKHPVAAELALSRYPLTERVAIFYARRGNEGIAVALDVLEQSAETLLPGPRYAAASAAVANGRSSYSQLHDAPSSVMALEGLGSLLRPLVEATAD